MSGFSGSWLALREPADNAARAPALVAAVAAALAAVDEPVVVDLGAGTGSTLRALAPALGPRQRWILVDGDAALLGLAAERLAAWGQGRGATVTARPDGVEIHEPAGCRLAIELRCADLALDPLPVSGRVDLVTASALLDLVSTAFVGALVRRVTERRAAFYAALDVDGLVRLEPARAEDAAVLAAFAADQGRDKGLGPALGPSASAATAAAFAERGWRVETGPSPWRLGPGDAALVAALCDGYASVAVSRGVLDPTAAARWRSLPRESVVVGHRDLLALPPAA